MHTLNRFCFLQMWFERADHRLCPSMHAMFCHFSAYISTGTTPFLANTSCTDVPLSCCPGQQTASCRADSLMYQHTAQQVLAFHAATACHPTQHAILLSMQASTPSWSACKPSMPSCSACKLSMQAQFAILCDAIGVRQHPTAVNWSPGHYKLNGPVEAMVDW